MAKGKILLVDDDADLRSSLQAILEGRDYEVVTAEGPEDGLARFADESPDLAILDVMMETWQDGFEMARHVKADDKLKNIPILMLTGVKDKSGIDFKSSAGDQTWLPVDAFLDKPVDSQKLLAEVERLLGKH